MSRDSMKQQILDACNRVKSAAEIMGFLMSVARMRKRDFPDDAPDSPRLRVTISLVGLMEKTGYSRSQVKRGIALLRQRGFILTEFTRGEKNQYQINEGAVERYLQRMPLFEQNEMEDQVHDEPTTRSMMNLPPGPSWTHHQGHHEPTPPYIASKASISIIRSDEDETKEHQTKTQVTTELLRHDVDHEGADPEREELIESCREVNISREVAEAHLEHHSRQKLKAGFQHLKRRLRRGDRIPSLSGFLEAFWRNPAQWEHEIDQHGHWRHVTEIRKEEQLRRQSRSRDSPAVDPRQAAYVAWDQLPTAQQQAIRQAIQQSQPDISPGLLMQRCREQALNITREAPCPKQP